MCGLSALAGFNHNCSKEKGRNTETEDNIYYALMDEDEVNDRCDAAEVHLMLKLLDCSGPQTMLTVVVVPMLTRPRNWHAAVSKMHLFCEMDEVPAFPFIILQQQQ